VNATEKAPAPLSGSIQSPGAEIVTRSIYPDGLTVATAVAPEPVPPLKLTVGALVNPLPAFVRVSFDNPQVELSSEAVAAALEPPPPENPTVGADV
jgi:hypothetical protein